MAESGGRGGKRQAAATASRGEWLCAALGAVITLGTIGLLGYEGLTQPRRGVPEIVVRVDSVVRQENGWLVQLEARNVGHATAAAVRIVGVLRADTGVVETSEANLDYVPEASSRGAGLLFSRDPSQHLLDVRPSGYARP
ncbi:MAG: hypothetical protein M3Y31_08360 [Gemmatimonadota bacterium]|nr:hypothetical protein [Gemmatimonadota bacterium]